MAKMKKVDDANLNLLWADIKINDFTFADSVDERNIGEYNYGEMKNFIANISYSRQLPKLFDGLKPVERRLMHALNVLKAYSKYETKKCTSIVGETNKYHPHGDGPIYGSLVNQVQYWKKAMPLIYGEGNFANPINADKAAHMRYTEAKLSKYAEECFFEDYEPECVENAPGSIMLDEPAVLPAKFPNVLINGAFGIASGNKLGIPPYHVDDIYRICKALIEDPETRNIYAVPEFPCGCDIVQEGRNLKEICETGRGTIKMRARIDIEETPHNYILHIRSLPWLIDLNSISERLYKLVKEGKLPIKDFRDGSQPYKTKKKETRTSLDGKVIISKNQDPYAIRNQLYKLTPLQTSMSVQFKIVTEDLYIGNMSMRDLLLTWLDERREYLRRLYNRKIAKLTARETFLKALIQLLKGDNSERLVQTIRNNRKVDAIKAICEMPLYDEKGKMYFMNSYQATKVAEMPLFALNKDAATEYSKEVKEVGEKISEIMKIIYSEKKINQIILGQLEDMKKYGEERKCRVVTLDNEKTIANTDHVIMISNGNMLKKLPVQNSTRKTTSTYGAFMPGDYPNIRLEANNYDSVMFFDNKGRYSIVPVAAIPNTDFNNFGSKVYDITKLEGKIIYACPYIDDIFKEKLEKYGTNLSLISISKNGYTKRTAINEVKVQPILKNGRYAKIKEGDEIVHVDLVFNETQIMIYTENGYFNYLKVEEIANMSLASQGLVSIALETGDGVVGCCAVGNDSSHIVVLTEKGCMKKVRLDSFGDTKKRKDASYITKVSTSTGKVLFCNSVRDNKSSITVCSKTGFVDVDLENVAELTRMALPQKQIPVANGDNIISMLVCY